MRMPERNIIRAYEFEKLYIDEAGNRPFQRKHWVLLCNYLEKSSQQARHRVEYFRILNKGIQFTNFVGVIQAGNLTIEVLPKVDKAVATARNETLADLEKAEPEIAGAQARWHKVLLDMLKECRHIQVSHVDYANLNLKSNSVLDVYIKLFLVEAERLLHEGLTKKYQERQGNQTALKGNLLFHKQVTNNSTRQDRFFVRYSEYTRDNIFNAIIHKTLCLIPRISSNKSFIDKTGRLQMDFPETYGHKINDETFDRLKFDRKTERYREAMLISRMLLLNFRPDISGGTENVIAILFDMNKLWEEFIFRRLKKLESAHDIIVERQQSRNFWRTSLMPRPKTIRPDMVIRSISTGRVIVLDTKWKIIDGLIPDDDDLKQMYVYNLFWSCDKSILLYPDKEDRGAMGDYIDFSNEKQTDRRCEVITTCILDDDGYLRKDLGVSLLNRIIKE